MSYVLLCQRRRQVPKKKWKTDLRRDVPPLCRTKTRDTYPIGYWLAFLLTLLQKLLYRIQDRCPSSCVGINLDIHGRQQAGALCSLDNFTRYSAGQVKDAAIIFIGSSVGIIRSSLDRRIINSQHTDSRQAQ